MRVIAGRYRSRPLRSMRGMDIRPTADRLRETLFDVLCAGNPDALAGSTWLDLYAGSGAVGIEALSRNAAMVYFAESSKAAAEVIEANLRSLGATAGFKVVRAETGKALKQWEGARIAADFVFLDPPYRLREEYAKSLGLLGDSAIVQATTQVIAEHEKRFDPGEVFGRLRRWRKLEQGDAALSFYRIA